MLTLTVTGNFFSDSFRRVYNGFKKDQICYRYLHPLQKSLMIAASLHASWNTKNKIKGKIKKCNSNKMDARSDFKLLSSI